MASPVEGFESWQAALSADGKSMLEVSKAHFQTAAQVFFDEGSSKKASIGRALFEYSTLMDAFALVQEGRLLKSISEYDISLSSFEKASEVLRSTLHFAFLSSYVSGCASLETALEMEAGEDSFQGFKNAIALFEQSKLLLSFRDEKHPLVHSIEVLLKYSISRALLVESENLSKTGSREAARKKKETSKEVEKDFEMLAKLDGEKRSLSNFTIDYFPKYECVRASTGALLVVFPEKANLWIGNVGRNAAFLEKIGEERIGKILGPNESISQRIEENFRGKLRISYEDTDNKNRFDEGCLTII